MAFEKVRLLFTNNKILILFFSVLLWEAIRNQLINSRMVVYKVQKLNVIIVDIKKLERLAGKF
jgi:competence transcription factor ComK